MKKIIISLLLLSGCYGGLSEKDKSDLSELLIKSCLDIKAQLMEKANDRIDDPDLATVLKSEKIKNIDPCSMIKEHINLKQ